MNYSQFIFALFLIKSYDRLQISTIALILCIIGGVHLKIKSSVENLNRERREGVAKTETPLDISTLATILDFFPLLPSPEHSISYILRHILYGQFRIDFGCLYRGMPHHDLQHLFGYSLPKSHRTGECMAGNMCG